MGLANKTIDDFQSRGFGLLHRQYVCRDRTRQQNSDLGSGRRRERELDNVEDANLLSGIALGVEQQAGSRGSRGDRWPLVVVTQQAIQGAISF